MTKFLIIIYIPLPDGGNNVFSRHIVSNNEIDKLKSSSFDSHLLVFVNGIFEKELSDYSELSNQIFISTISEAFECDNELVEKYFSKISMKIQLSISLIYQILLVDCLYIFLKMLLLKNQFRYLILLVMLGIFHLALRVI